MFKRPLFLVHALAAMLASNPVKDSKGNLLTVDRAWAPRDMFNRLRSAHRKARSTYWPAQIKHAKEGSGKTPEQNEVIASAIQKRRRRAVILNRHARYWPQQSA